MSARVCSVLLVLSVCLVAASYAGSVPQCNSNEVLSQMNVVCGGGGVQPGTCVGVGSPDSMTCNCTAQAGVAGTVTCNWYKKFKSGFNLGMAPYANYRYQFWQTISSNLLCNDKYGLNIWGANGNPKSLELHGSHWNNFPFNTFPGDPWTAPVYLSISKSMGTICNPSLTTLTYYGQVL